MSHPYIHEAEKHTIVRMNQRRCSTQDIIDATGRAKTTVYRILAMHRATGDVVVRNLPLGRRRALSALDSQVCISYTALH